MGAGMGIGLWLNRWFMGPHNRVWMRKFWVAKRIFEAQRIERSMNRGIGMDLSSSVDRRTVGLDLSLCMHRIPLESKPLPGYTGSSMFQRTSLGVCMDEVFNQLYVGDIGAAKNKEYLKRVGITHVVNTAQGRRFATVDTDAEYYADVGIQYMGISCLDLPDVKIKDYFHDTANFIDGALNNGGKVLVHCFMGVSRSATIASSFLMQKRNMTAVEALQTLRKNRAIFPNDGFMDQLAELDNNLRRERGQLHGNL